jgi:GAF domain-containing protein
MDAAGWLRHGAAPRLPESFNNAVDVLPAAGDAVPWAVAAHTKRVVSVENIPEHPQPAFRALALSCGLRASWTTPIVAPLGGVLGTLSLFYRDCARPSQMEEESATIFASLAGLFISHTRMMEAASQRPPPRGLLRKA